MPKLEIGPGENPLPGFDLLDMVARPGDAYPGDAYKARWGYERLPIDANTYDEVYASHVLEHIPWNKTHQALLEIRRILKPGGKFEVWVPDFAYIIQCYHEKECGDRWRRDNPEGNYMLWLNGRIFTYGPGKDNWHHACFDYQYLKHCLKKAEFVNVSITDKRDRGTSHGPIDLGAIAYKPE